MAVLTDQQRKFYETTLQVTKQEVSDLKDQIGRASCRERVSSVV